MLQPQHSYAAFPPAALYHLLLPDAVLLLYPSVDGIVILDAQSLVLRHVLAFWEAFPGTRHSKDTITCMTIDAGMKLVVAAMKSCVAAWSPSGKQNSWRVHSTLVLPSTSVVTTLDSKSGLLAVGCLSGLSVYTLILDNDLPTWSPKWVVPTPIPALIRFCPSLQFIAVTTQTDNEVRIYATTSGRQTQGICHPRPVINLSWRHSQASSRDDLTLYTITSDSTLRIFMPVLDLPRRLQLHASLDPFSCLPFSITSKYTNPSDSTVFWLDRGTVTQALESALSGSPPEDDVRSRRIKDIINEGWDLFFRIFSDGSIVVTAVANIDRRPPTLLKQFTLQHLFPPSLHPPLHLFVLPSGTPSCLTLITSPPLASHIILPLSFFDAQVDGFQLKAELLTRVSEEEAEVVRFMRTPEGRGVAAVRGNGGGDVWRVGEKGTKLQRSGCWVAAEFVVVLNEGRNFAAYSFQTGILTLYGSKIHSIPLPRIISLFSLPSQEQQENIFAITTSFIIIQIRVIGEHELFIHSESRLPLSTPPQKILPVDPMSWSTNRTSNSEHDVLLSLSGTGELQFWLPEGDTSPEWRCTGKVRTGRLGMRKARCSSAKKTALIVPTPDGEELTIWDSKESEFAAGLEYRYIYNEKVNDLDWTSTPDQQSILAVGFTYHVELLCQQRMTYFEHVLGWSLCHRIEIGSSIPYPISDSIWLANGSFLIGAGHHLCLYGESKSTEIHESLFEYVARLNGPLPDYHPQMLLQCLLWGKVELVKNIIINLVHDLKAYDADPRIWHWTSLPVSQFYETDASSMNGVAPRTSISFLDGVDQQEENDAIFSRRLVTSLIDALENQPIPHLTPNEQAHLIVLIQTTLEIDEQRRALDSNGLRYLISMRSFYILNRRASAPVSPESYCAQHRHTGTGRRERLRYRDMVWAFHSECQGLLLNASIAACNGKMVWSDARALGLPLWLNSTEELKSQLEMIARNEYLAGDNRDPTACSLFYFALGKIKLVYGLWRQAAWHKEQTVMLKFLSNDFSEPRWRTAALKNAYALMSKQRFEYAAAFFLLGNSLKDAVNVCIKQLGDFQLAVALARVVEQGNEGPVLLEILNNHVLPIAFTNGNRWLASWAFWLLHRRDLAVRVLLTPLQDITSAYGIVVEEIGEPHYDDPSLALLFRQLRAKTLQAVKGTSEISGRSEFNFVLQMARVFCRMGCHPLALDLVRSWSFEHPSSYAGAPQPITPSSPTVSRNIFAIESNLRHRSSILIDMDIPSLPPTRAVSPQPGPKLSAHDQGDLASRKTRIGNLMKFAKKDVQVPEFDMNAFI